MPPKVTFASRLRQAREIRNLSQSELAERARMAVAMISHFETGVRASASADNLVKLANALEISIDYLLGRSDDPIPRDGPVQATLLRALGGATLDHIESVTRIAEALKDTGTPTKKPK